MAAGLRGHVAAGFVAAGLRGHVATWKYMVSKDGPAARARI